MVLVDFLKNKNSNRRRQPCRVSITIVTLIWLVGLSWMNLDTWMREKKKWGRQEVVVAVQEAPTDCPRALLPSIDDEKIFAASSKDIARDHVHPWDELYVCDPLRLVYIHVYKSWGSYVGNTLIANCQRVWGLDSTRVLSRWTGDTTVRNYNLGRLCESYHCFTFYRDPIDRFLSGYHEIMKRRNASVPMDEGKDHLAQFIKDLVSGRFRNPHVMPQTQFIRAKKINAVSRVPGLTFASVERSQDIMETLFCGSMSKICQHVSCDYEPLESDQFRRRLDPSYGSQNFIFSLKDLSDAQIEALETYYMVDYCNFAIQPRVSKVYCPGTR